MCCRPGKKSARRYGAVRPRPRSPRRRKAPPAPTTARPPSLRSLQCPRAGRRMGGLLPRLLSLPAPLRSRAARDGLADNETSTNGRRGCAVDLEEKRTLGVELLSLPLDEVGRLIKLAIPLDHKRRIALDDLRR